MTTKDATTTKVISVVVAHVRHTSDGFSVYTADAEGQLAARGSAIQQEITIKQFVGPVQRGQRWVLAGKMQRDERLDRRGNPYGEQFAAAFATLGIPENVWELDAMLSSGLIDGWGMNHSARLLGALHAEKNIVERVLVPHNLESLGFVSDAMIESLAAALQRAGSLASIYAQLAEWEVTGKLADKLIKYHGFDTIARLQADPYFDILHIDGYGWKSADSLGNRLGIPLDDPRRLTAGIAVALYTHTWQAGHTWLTEFEACRAAGALLGVAYSKVEAQLAHALAAGDVVLDSGRLYPVALHRAEEAIADHIARRVMEEIRVVDLKELAEASMGDTDDKQWAAIVLGLTAPISLLTGGPGVGKTTTLRELVRQARKEGLQPTCMAPTGKAAARMTEATGWPATTIHSKLKITPGVYDVEGDIEPLTGLVIVDEVSMLDTTLAAQLLARLAPTARLLLVGDPDQLPSVGPGAVLRDLLDARVIPNVHLEKVYRNDAGIAVNAKRIREGKNIIELPDVVLMDAETPAHAAQLVQGLLYELQQQGMAHTDILVLTPTNDGPSGRYTLNRELQPLLNPALPGEGITQYVGSGSDPASDGIRRTEELRMGDRVMVTKNSADLGVFNGQVGVVVAVQQPKALEVEIEGRRVRFAGEDKRSLTLAYAITGHKSQGSEAKVVIAPIFPSRVLSREWLYTVLTRARDSAYLIGDVGAMQACLEVRRATERHTGLVSRIHARLAAAEVGVNV